MSIARGILLGTAAAGAIAAGLAGGAAGGAVAERRIVRSPRLRPDPVSAENFGQLPADRSSTVAASDGVDLYVEETGPLDAPLTVVFSHGYTLEMACWHFQRQELGDLGRLVFWDQRAHGRSGRSRAENCTIDQLGDDLAQVLEACAPAGPVVLVGHSMGGMTIMALAAARPDLFLSDGRVVGVALLGTSAGQLAKLTFGLPRLLAKGSQRVTPKMLVGLGRRASFIDARRQRGLGSDVFYALTRRLAFGSRDVSPVLVEVMERMINATSVEVVSAFAPAFLSHDKLDALANLRDVPVLVLNGSKDVLTPPDHSEAIAEALPDAEHVVLPGAGHMVMMERPELTNLYLRALIGRAVGATGHA